MVLENGWLLADVYWNSLVTFQSFISCEVSDEGEVLKMPTEKGGFADYNKVAEPMKIRVNLALQGTDADIQTALTNLKTLKDGTQTFYLITPTTEYKNMTLESYNYARKREDGLKVCYVEMSLVEVREVEAQYTATTSKKRLTQKKVKRADCASPQATGKTTAQAPAKSAEQNLDDWARNRLNKKKGLTVDSSGTGGR